MSSKHERIPLEWLIEQKQFLKPLWDEFSVPQQTVIKAFYGLPLVSEAEQRAWAVLNDSCEYDDLGFVTAWTPVEYVPKERKIVVGLLGRRGGKSLIMSFILLYECLFGGHLAHTQPGQDVIVPYVAQDLATAKSNMRYVSLLANKVPALAKEIATDSRDKITFKNGITIQPEPPSIKTGRGVSIPVLVMDEVAFWYKMAENANPDYEVLNALEQAQTQFAHPKILIISTPYTEEGLLWEFWLAGTDGQKLADSERRKYANTLVVTSSTAAMENPAVNKHGRKTLEGIQARNPEIFVRESLARFIASESNFIPGYLVDECTDTGVTSRLRVEIEKGGILPSYVAVMDPAFRHDDFAFSIGHMDGSGRVIQDLLHVWTPDSKQQVRLKPEMILGQIGNWLREWNIPVVYSDQYHLDSLQSIAQEAGFSIIQQQFTSQSKAKIYGSLVQLLKTKRIRLLDIPTIRQQLSQLNQKQTAGGNVHIGAPPGKKDDIATVCALMAHVALKYMPQITVKKQEPTLFQQMVARTKQRKEEAGWDSGDVW